jgi:hypothetical protein
MADDDVIRLSARIVCKGCHWRGEAGQVEVVVYEPDGAKPFMAVRSLTLDDIVCEGCGALLDLWVEERWHGDRGKRDRRRLSKGYVTVHGRPRASN